VGEYLGDFETSTSCLYSGSFAKDPCLRERTTPVASPLNSFKVEAIPPYFIVVEFRPIILCKMPCEVFSRHLMLQFGCFMDQAFI